MHKPVSSSTRYRLRLPPIQSKGEIKKPRKMSHRHSIDSCTLQLHTWRPFTLDSPTAAAVFTTKRPCRADRRTSFAVEALDMSRLSLFDDDRTLSISSAHKREGNGIRWFARKRRRRGSRSVSGRSSDRSATTTTTHRRRRCCSVGASAAYGTCSDFPIAPGTDSSGELFVNGADPNWSSDVSEAARTSRMGKERDGGSGERENLGSGFGQNGNMDSNHPGQGNESGYGSEPGYRGDAEFGYGDEFDEEEDDPRLPFWGEQFGDTISNALQKTHHRCRRKKHDLRMINALR